MKTADIRSLTKFLPALCSGELAEWSAEPVSAEDIASCPAPTAEYWDVVHRFAEAVFDLAERMPNKGEGADLVAEAAVRSLAEMLGREEECPGILLGYIKNGTLTRVLGRLNDMLG